MEEKIEKVDNSKKKLILILTICVMTLLLVVGISYALWQTTKVQEDTNIIASGCFDVSLEGKNPINLANTFPITDNEGKTTTPYTFTVKNKCSVATNYDISLESLVNSTLDSSKIKVMINDNMKLLNNFTETEKYFENSKDSRVLATGTLKAEETVTYNLRLWIDESVTNEDQNKTFDSKIIVKASVLGNPMPINIVEIGDYISMTPSSTSYTISKDLTGYSSDQKINPSELNLWRVISKNEDGTVEMVSDKVSSISVFFKGKNGYMNLVGGLNTIAAQYTDGKHVQSTRHMGYSNQTEKCSSYTASDCGTDTGYITDLELVNVAYGGSSSCPNGCSSLAAYKAGTTTAQYYWLPSRLYGNSTYYGRAIEARGVVSHNVGLIIGEDIDNNSNGAVRPILTLKADALIIRGDGASPETAYSFE